MRGLILYGPPASGKDTVTAALAELDRGYRPVPKLKVGRGNTHGYRMATHAELVRLRSEGRIVQEHMRYGNVYAVDHTLVAATRAGGGTPVLHTGRLDDLRTLLRSLPGRWTVVVLWCTRRTAERRSIARSDRDTADRMKVWDETLCELPRLASDEVTLWVDTEATSPAAAAEQVDRAVETAEAPEAQHRPAAAASAPDAALGVDPGREPGLIVPVVTPRAADGHVDDSAVLRYAQQFVAWHPSAVPLVAASYGRGSELGEAGRQRLAELWRRRLGPRSLAAAAYSAAETERIVELGAWPLFVPPEGSTVRSLRRELGGLLPGVWLYSHPDRWVATPDDAAALAPRGLKLAKCGLDRLADVRSAVGPAGDLWHATARDPAASRRHGATSVVAACLADLPRPAPASRSTDELSRAAAHALRRTRCVTSTASVTTRAGSRRWSVRCARGSAAAERSCAGSGASPSSPTTSVARSTVVRAASPTSRSTTGRS